MYPPWYNTQGGVDTRFAPESVTQVRVADLTYVYQDTYPGGAVEITQRADSK